MVFIVSFFNQTLGRLLIAPKTVVSSKTAVSGGHNHRVAYKSKSEVAKLISTGDNQSQSSLW